MEQTKTVLLLFFKIFLDFFQNLFVSSARQFIYSDVICNVLNTNTVNLDMAL